MSNRRKPDYERARYAGYLQSPVWAATRAHWYWEERQQTGRAPECAVCLAIQPLELHHLDYKGVVRIVGGWISNEGHSDLLPLCSTCHEAVHRALDTDPGYSLFARRAATLRVVATFRERLTRLVMGGAHDRDTSQTGPADR